MKRIYANCPLAADQIGVQGDIYHRLVKVLRIKIGNIICLFNGDGSDYFFEIMGISKKSIDLRFLEKKENKTESPLYSILLQGVSKGEKMDFALQKAVELGVNEIIPVQTEFSAVKISAERADKKQKHWLSIIQSACEQSERATLPVLHSITRFEDSILALTCPHRVIFAPRHSSQVLPSSLNKIALLVGPEGGFSDAEMAFAEHHRFVSLNLGGRILRTETAAVCALTFAQIKWGDMDA